MMISNDGGRDGRACCCSGPPPQGRRRDRLEHGHAHDDRRSESVRAGTVRGDYPAWRCSKRSTPSQVITNLPRHGQGVAGASAEAAAVAAAYRVLATYFPASLSTLNAARASSLGSIPNGSAKDAGIAVGEAAANAMITLRADDGSAPPEFYVPPSFNPGQWQVTPSCPAAGGTFLQWRNVTPFGSGAS